MNNGDRSTIKSAMICGEGKLFKEGPTHFAGCVVLVATIAAYACSAPGKNIEIPAKLTVTTNVLRGAEKVPPLVGVPRLAKAGRAARRRGLRRRLHAGRVVAPL